MIRGVQTPSKSVVPSWHANYYDEIVDLCDAYGLLLDPWQQNVLKAASGEDAFGRWSASRVGLSVPRQCGKTALFEARELAGLLLYDEQLIIHSAHLLATALEGFERIKSYFENYDDLGKKVRRIRLGNGDQSIEMMDGKRLLFKARALGGIRGFSPDLLMLDEAQILGARQWSAMLPAMSARPNPQAWLAGTPPTPDDDAEAFTNIRRAALNGNDSRVAWLEWSMDEGDDIDSLNTWAKAIPALGSRVQVTSVEDERNSMQDDQFMRERLGFWDSEIGSQSAIPVDAWADRAVEEVPDDWPLAAVGLDMNPERTKVTIAVAAWSPDGVHVELAEDAPFTEDGTLALVDWVWKRCKRRIPVVIDAYSPLRSIEPEFRRRGMKVFVLSGAELSQACGGFFDAVVRDESLTHFDQDALNLSLAGASKEKFGNGGAWKWSRKSLETDLTPIYAATCAHFGAVKFGKRVNADRDRKKVVIL